MDFRGVYVNTWQVLRDCEVMEPPVMESHGINEGSEAITLEFTQVCVFLEIMPVIAIV